MCEFLKWIIILEYLPDLIFWIIVLGAIIISGICGLVTWLKDEFF